MNNKTSAEQASLGPFSAGFSVFLQVCTALG
jgi:hypothetical protein